MEQENKLPIDEIVTAGVELISDRPPKTIAGKILRWIKKLVRIKNYVGIKIK